MYENNLFLELGCVANLHVMVLFRAACLDVFDVAFQLLFSVLRFQNILPQLLFRIPICAWGVNLLADYRVVVGDVLDNQGLEYCLRCGICSQIIIKLHPHTGGG